MSTDTFYNWVLPLGIAAVGACYAVWGRWNDDRNARRLAKSEPRSVAK